MKQSHESVIEQYKNFEAGFARALAWRELSEDKSKAWEEIIAHARQIAQLVRGDIDQNCKKIEELCGNFFYLERRVPRNSDLNYLFSSATQLEKAAISVCQARKKEIDKMYSPTDANPYPWVEVVEYKEYESPDKVKGIPGELKSHVIFSLSEDREIVFDSHGNRKHPVKFTVGQNVLIREFHLQRNKVTGQPQMGVLTDIYCIITIGDNQTQIGKPYEYSLITIDYLMDQIKYSLNNIL